MCYTIAEQKEKILWLISFQINVSCAVDVRQCAQ